MSQPSGSQGYPSGFNPRVHENGTCRGGLQVLSVHAWYSNDLVVLGGGTAGLVGAMGAAGLGARVALVEHHLLGGDCLNTGCVPSKALIRSARAVGELRKASSLGVETSHIRVDFPAVMQRLRLRRAQIAVHDSAARLQAAGVDVFFGDGRFADPATVVVDGASLRFRRALIATGGRPTAPPIPGLDAVPYLTNETIFDLTELPRRLIVIGAGPIGCELAQAFARFGSTVTLLDQSTQVLPREDPMAALVLRRLLEREGLHLELGVRIDRARAADGEVHLEFTGDQPRRRLPRGQRSDSREGQFRPDRRWYPCGGWGRFADDDHDDAAALQPPPRGRHRRACRRSWCDECASSVAASPRPLADGAIRQPFPTPAKSWMPCALHARWRATEA